MARTINAGGTQVKRKDSFGLDPEQIIFDIDTNVRWHAAGEQPLDHEKVVQYAREFINPATGQIAPIGVREVENKRVKVVYGFHRLAAAILVKNGSEVDGIPACPDFRIDCIVRDVNREEGIRLAIRENKSRLENSSMDDAENMRKLRTIGDDDANIVATLGLRSPNQLKTLVKLLKLPDAIKLKVHLGEIPLDVAGKMADMSDEDQALIVAAAVADTPATDTPMPECDAVLGSLPSAQATLANRALTTGAAARADGPVDKRKLRRIVKERQRASGKDLGLSIAEFRIFLSELSANADLKIQRLAEAMFEFLGGKIDNAAAEKKVLELVAAN